MIQAPHRTSLELEKLVVAHESSSLSIKTYCLENKINRALFYKVRRRLLKPSSTYAENSISNFINITPPPAPTFQREDCSLTFTDGRILRFPASIIKKALVSMLGKRCE